MLEESEVGRPFQTGFDEQETSEQNLGGWGGEWSLVNFWGSSRQREQKMQSSEARSRLARKGSLRIPILPWGEVHGISIKIGTNDACQLPYAHLAS